LARVSIENDEMMQDTPERALNKIFAGLKNKRAVDRKHVEVIFNLQQAVLDGLEYLEENQRELPIGVFLLPKTTRSIFTLTTPHQKQFVALSNMRWI
jgi:hypothetical protein